MINASQSLAKMRSDVYKIKADIRKFNEVTVISHLDADGITSAGIANATFERLGIPVKTHIVRQLDKQRIDEILNISTENILFTDLGSGQIGSIKSILDCRNVLIIDHHVPSRDTHKNIMLHFNSHLYDVDGSRDVSGAGLCYFFSRFMIGECIDMSSLALVGAVGDMQTRDGLSGFNKMIVEEGRGVYVDVVKDLSYFGKQTRPVHKMLSFASDPYLPGITGNEEFAIKFVGDQIQQVDSEDDKWKYWIDLSLDEKQSITTALISRLMSFGCNPSVVKRLVANTYILLKEQERMETRDAMEFSTLLNACGRHDEWGIGLNVVLGDRDKSLARARSFLQEHRAQLAKGISLLKDKGVQQLKNIQIFKADEIKSTIIGIVVGMAMGSRIIDHKKPIVAVSCDVDPGFYKISARGTMSLVARGLKLNNAMSLSLKVGGEGGGHDVAAGAKIKKACLSEFLDIVDVEVGKQLSVL